MSNPALASVRKGVTLVYAGLLTILLGIIATFVLPFLFLGIMGSADKAGPIVLSVMIGVILVGGLMMFVGQCLCMVAPTSLKPIPILRGLKSIRRFSFETRTRACRGTICVHCSASCCRTTAFHNHISTSFAPRVSIVSRL